VSEEGFRLARAVWTKLALDHHRQFDRVHHADPGAIADFW
jgi:hypothetical protein